MKTLTNTTVVSNFAAVGRRDLLKQVHGQLYMPTQVYEEILDGLEEGYEFYNAIEGQIYPLAETGWLELVSMIHDEEIRHRRTSEEYWRERSMPILTIHQGNSIVLGEALESFPLGAWAECIDSTRPFFLWMVCTRQRFDKIFSHA